MAQIIYDDLLTSFSLYLLYLYTFSEHFFLLPAVESLYQEIKILFCVQLLQAGKNKTIC